MPLNLFTIKSSYRGFSILEVLITLGIIGIITALILVKYGAFHSTTLLNSQVYELALDLREIQTYSVSARGNDGGSDFREEYGLYFTTNQPNRYLLFLDDDQAEPAQYHAGEEIGEPYVIDSRFAISRICINNCSQNVDNLAVSFKRPDFDARFFVLGQVTEPTSAQIEIANIADPSDVRAVAISATGQIDIVK